ncbi:hypothetical protein [Streptomyces jumonjinensis]|uniref:hypothetical protein n=1 Tax=Streptomyces jumonjinensis TaxID=1945 RepID=UPI0037B3FEE5
MTVHGWIAALAHGRGQLAELLREELGEREEIVDLAGAESVEWRGDGVDARPCSRHGYAAEDEEAPTGLGGGDRPGR